MHFDTFISRIWGLTIKNNIGDKEEYTQHLESCKFGYHGKLAFRKHTHDTWNCSFSLIPGLMSGLVTRCLGNIEVLLLEFCILENCRKFSISTPNINV